MLNGDVPLALLRPESTAEEHQEWLLRRFSTLGRPYPEPVVEYEQAPLNASAVFGKDEYPSEGMVVPQLGLDHMKSLR